MVWIFEKNRLDFGFLVGTENQGVPWDVNTWNAKILIPSNHLREIFDIFDIPFDNCFDIRCQRVVNKDVKDCPCCQQKSFDILRCQSIPVLRKLLISQCITFYLSELKWVQVCTLSYQVFLSTRKNHLFSGKVKIKANFHAKMEQKTVREAFKKSSQFQDIVQNWEVGSEKITNFLFKIQFVHFSIGEGGFVVMSKLFSHNIVRHI